VAGSGNGIVPPEEIARVVDALQRREARELGGGIPRLRALVSVAKVHVGLEIGPTTAQLQQAAQALAKVVQKGQFGDLGGEAVDRAVFVGGFVSNLPQVLLKDVGRENKGETRLLLTSRQ